MTKLPHENEVIKKKFKKDGKQYYKNTCRVCGRHVQYTHGTKPVVCPHCGEDDFIKPITETRLFLLQKKYLKERDDNILWSMYILFREYSASLIKKSLPASFSYHYQDVEEKASELALIMFELYKKKKNFAIIKSFGAYLNSKVPQVLWNKKEQKEQDHESLYNSLGDGEHEIIHITDQIGYTPIFREWSEYFEEKEKVQSLYTTINDLFKSIFKAIRKNHNPYFYIQTMIGVWHYIKKSGHIEEFYEVFGDKAKDFIDNSTVILYEFLQEY